MQYRRVGFNKALFFPQTTQDFLSFVIGIGQHSSVPSMLGNSNTINVPPLKKDQPNKHVSLKDLHTYMSKSI